MRWEYRTHRGRVYDNLNKFLTQLGEEGWELVAALPVNTSVEGILDNGTGEITGGGTESVLFIFKRPRPANA